MKLGQTRLVLGMILLALLSTLGCKTPPPVSWRDMPAPDGVSRSFYNGPSEVRANLAIVSAVEALRAGGSGPLDIGGLWPVDTIADGQPAADWRSVEAFYARALAAPAFAGFVRDSVRADLFVPAAVWTRSRGPFGPPDRIGVLFVPGRPDDALAFVVPFNSRLAD